MVNSSKISINKELFKSSIVLSCAIILIFGILLSTILYYSELANAQALVRQRNQTDSCFIDGYFTKIHNAVEFLSSNTQIRNAIAFDQADNTEILTLYKSLQLSDPDINYVYSGYNNGSLLINDYTPPAGFNSVVRPWYKAAMAAQPDISDGIPYQDIIDKQWLVSISRVLTATNGTINGVVAIDSSIDTVANILKKQDGRYKSSHSFAAKIDGEIIIHHDKNHLSHTVTSRFNTNIDLNQPEGKFTVSFNGVDKLAYYTRIDKIGWVIVTMVDKKEIIQPIINKIVLTISAIVGVAILLGWVLSANLSKRIVTPLEELKQRVGDILADNRGNGSTYIYPNNEIGAIAADIEQLADNELHDKNLKLQNINQELELLSTTDQLTSLFNRRKMDMELEKELARSQRYQLTFSLIMFDIDRFKNINDSYGHQAGDKVLEEVATLTHATLRSTDIVSRWGGDEFLILCPETTLNGAKALAENLHAAIGNNNFALDTNVTISVGGCEFCGQKDVEEMLKQVDKKLYAAKQQGRNLVVV